MLTAAAAAKKSKNELKATFHSGGGSVSDVKIKTVTGQQ